MGFAGRVPRAGGLAGTSERDDRKPARESPGRRAGQSHRKVAGNQQIAVAESWRNGQPRQPFLSRAVLGTGIGRAERRSGIAIALWTVGADAGGKRGEDCRVTEPWARAARKSRWDCSTG